MTEKELLHYGILGMKWGKRKYRNTDGSLTNKGIKKEQKQIKKQIEKRSQDVQIDSYNTAVDKINNDFVKKFNDKWAPKFKGYTDWSESPNYNAYINDYSEQSTKKIIKYMDEAVSKNPNAKFSTFTGKEYVARFLEKNDGNISWEENIKHHLYFITEKELIHYGVPGMKWGKRKGSTNSESTTRQRSSKSASTNETTNKSTTPKYTTPKYTRADQWQENEMPKLHEQDKLISKNISEKNKKILNRSGVTLAQISSDFVSDDGRLMLDQKRITEAYQKRMTKDLEKKINAASRNEKQKIASSVFLDLYSELYPEMSKSDQGSKLSPDQIRDFL